MEIEQGCWDGVWGEYHFNIAICFCPKIELGDKYNNNDDDDIKTVIIWRHGREAI